MIDIEYFKSIQGSIGLNSKKEVLVNSEKTRIAREMISSSHYESKARRNELYQPLIISPTRTSNISNIFTLPDDDLHAGDIIRSEENRWLVSETSVANPFQTRGKAWLCNQFIRFQNHNSRIIERWGFLDTGIHRNEGTNLLSLDYNSKLYLPYDEDTKMLFVDKRLAISKGYDSIGKEIVVVYKITGITPLLKSYGEGSHLLSLTLEGADYVLGRDNIDEMICDFIHTGAEDEEHDDNDELLSCVINGRNSIYIGTSRTYTSVFYDSNGDVTDQIQPVWGVLPELPGVSFIQNGSSIIIFVENKDLLIGEDILLSVSDIAGLYNTSTFKVVIT